MDRLQEALVESQARLQAAADSSAGGRRYNRDLTGAMLYAILIILKVLGVLLKERAALVKKLEELEQEGQ